jgi:hypothetical protein
MPSSFLTLDVSPTTILAYPVSRPCSDGVASGRIFKFRAERQMCSSVLNVRRKPNAGDAKPVTETLSTKRKWDQATSESTEGRGTPTKAFKVEEGKTANGTAATAAAIAAKIAAPHAANGILSGSGLEDPGWRPVPPVAISDALYEPPRLRLQRVDGLRHHLAAIQGVVRESDAAAAACSSHRGRCTFRSSIQ